jgi:flagellar basal body-associated protein FliL
MVVAAGGMVVMIVFVMTMGVMVVLVIVIWFLFGSQDETRARWTPAPKGDGPADGAALRPQGDER